MATADVISPVADVDRFIEAANAFVRNPTPLIKYKEVMNQEPDGVFAFQAEHFIKLQLYVKSAFKLPRTIPLFESTYPYGNFSEWLTNDQYNTIPQIMCPIHEHCAVFETNAINALVLLSHQVSEYAVQASELMNVLKGEFEIICDKNRPLDGADVKAAKENATDILGMLKSNSEDLEKKCHAIMDAIVKFQSETEADSTAVKGLVGTLDTFMPESKINEKMTKRIAEVRKTLLAFQKQQQETLQEADDCKGVKWYYFVPYVGPVMGIKNAASFKDSMEKLKRLQDENGEAKTKADKEKLQLLHANTNVRTLSHLIHDVDSSIQGAKDALEAMANAMGSMTASSESLANNLEALAKQVREEAAGSVVVVRMKVDYAVRAWDNVLFSAKGFAKTGLVVNAEKNEPPPASSHEPTVLAAHHGGQDVTSYAQLLFVDGNNLVIDANDLPWNDPWHGNRKSMSVVYRHDGVIRVFVADSEGENKKWTFTPGDLSPSDVSRAADISPAVPGMIQIHAVMYGVQQVTDPNVYQRLYDLFASNQAVPVNNDTFGMDAWHGIAKSAAVVYSLNGQVRTISGREFDNMVWQM